MKKILLFLLLILSISAMASPKREFRGVWIQTAFQTHYKNMDGPALKKYFTDMLDSFEDAGFNAVVFQVRPTADAFYKSDLEPWSRFLTGERGKDPAFDWDPMEFLIEECHKRFMEFHAWINPYRVTCTSSERLPSNHMYYKESDRFVKFDGKIYFDPGQPQNRVYIKEIVNDIVRRYDIDAIHFDDYFYPYPVKGKTFNDDASFALYGQKMGFSKNQRNDWRRQNVNILIKYIQNDIKKLKPWVRFGISPFGIYRNQASSEFGSKTRGLQNYDDLYADVLRWSMEGWVDYMVPQLYWEIGNKSADYKELVNWWDDFYEDKHLYIGQDIGRSLDGEKLSLAVSSKHFDEKMKLTRAKKNVSGNCFWFGYQIYNNDHDIADVLKDKYHTHRALVPAYTEISKTLPKEVINLRSEWRDDEFYLVWDTEKARNEIEEPKFFCIYRFPKGVDKDIENPKYLIKVTYDTEYKLPYLNGKRNYTYVITTVDRVNNESKRGVARKIKL